MGIMDILCPNNKKSLADEMLKGARPEADPEQQPAEPVPDVFSIQPGPDALAASPRPLSAPADNSAVDPDPAPEAPPPAARRPLTPPSGVADASREDDADSERLERPLRQLFTENSAMDPQLEGLLGRVAKMGARDLADELKDLSRFIGADARARRSQG